MLNDKECEVVIRTLVSKITDLECTIMLKKYEIEKLEKEIEGLQKEVKGDNKNE